MKKAYEKPYIKRYAGGIVNKFGGLTQTHVQERIEDIKVSDLIKEYGSPLFVYSERILKQKYHHLMDAFLLRYPKVQHAWSYKTNYLKAICKSFHNLGSWAEVVSEMEYEMACNLGVEPCRIVVNGPWKPYSLLKKALQKGSFVNVDSMDELYDAEKIAAELGAPVNIGLRVNMALGAWMAWDRFGFNLESGEVHQVVRRALSGGKIRIAGLHAHIGTFILDPELYRSEVLQLISLCKMLKDEFKIQLTYLDIGGGFASPNRLRGALLSTGDMAPPFERFAEAVCGEVLAAFKPDESPLLLLETGRALIDEAGMLISSVAATKRLPNGMRGLILDAGVNLLFTSFWYDHELIPAVDRGDPLEDHVVYGPLCMQIDVIRPQVKLPSLQKGDPVIIKPAGAYNNTQWLQFIHLRPNVIMIGENRQVSVIRGKETIDYLQEQEQIPSWLKE